MLTDKDYEDWSKKLGKKFEFSARVIRHIRSVYKAKYSDLDLDQFKRHVINDADKKASDIRRSNKPLILEMVHTLSQDINGLNDSFRVQGFVNAKLNFILGGINKLGYYISVIKTVKKLTQEQFDEIIADILDSERTDDKT